MVRPGEVVSFVDGSKIRHALVLRWNRNPDSPVRVFALLPGRQLRGRVYERFHWDLLAPGERMRTGMVLLQVADASGVRGQLEELRHSKYGRQVVQAATLPAFVLIQPPTPGKGMLAAYDVPTKLTTHEPTAVGPKWTRDFERYLSRGDREQERWQWEDERYVERLHQLKAHNPRQYEVYMRSLHRDEKLVDIATLLRITPANARVLKHRAKNFLLQKERS